MDPRAVERFRLSGQCMERLLAALLKQTNTTNAAGAAPPEDLARRDPDVPSGVRTRSQRARECTNAAAAGDLTRLKRANENGCPWDESVCEAVAGRGQLLRTFKLLRRESLKKRGDVSMTTSLSPARRRVVPAFLKLDFC